MTPCRILKTLFRYDRVYLKNHNGLHDHFDELWGSAVGFEFRDVLFVESVQSLDGGVEHRKRLRQVGVGGVRHRLTLGLLLLDLLPLGLHCEGECGCGGER